MTVSSNKKLLILLLIISFALACSVSVSADTSKSSYTKSSSATSDLSKVDAILTPDIFMSYNSETQFLISANYNLCYPIRFNGKVYFPIRGTAMCLGKKVDWDAKSNTVIIKDRELDSNGEPVYTEQEISEMTPKLERLMVSIMKSSFGEDVDLSFDENLNSISKSGNYEKFKTDNESIKVTSVKSQRLNINGKVVEITSDIINHEGSVYLPIDKIVNLFDKNIEYNEELKLYTVTDKN